MRYLSCADTAKLVRQALKESFPGTKFSVKSKTYSGGASIDVKWTDGPTGAQVDAVVGPFKGGYFDGMIDYKGTVYARLDGELVRFGADFIFTNRQHSDALLAECIAMVASLWGAEPISVADYRNGHAWNWTSPNGARLDTALNHTISNMLGDGYGMATAIKPSPTLARVAAAGDDGYGYGTTGNAANGWQSGQGYAGVRS